MSTSQTTPRVLNGIDVDALNQTIAAVGEQPELGATTFRADCRWIDSRRIATTIDGFSAAGGEHRRPAAHELTTDLPEALAGTDAGPSPLELALSALGSCVTATLAVHAAAKGITLRSASVALTGDLDLRGFLNIAEVRVGYERLKLEIALDVDLPADEVASFVDSGLRFSPVLDLFRCGTEVEAAVARTPIGDAS
jgi:uncharacterized OsmC-like protein